MGKMKVMCCNVGTGQMENSGKWPCGVCRKGLGANSIVCTACQQWVHRRCSGLTGSLSVVVGFQCSRCVKGIGRKETMKEVQVENVGKLECVSKFC
jgi:PHD-finger